MRGRARSRQRARGVRQSALWTPLSESGCVLWLSDNSNFVALAQPTVSSPTDLSSGSWTRTRLASVTHGQSDPDGGTSGDLITENTGAGVHWVTQALGGFVTAIPANVSCAFKYVDCAWVWLQQGVSSVFFNVQTGAVGTSLGATATIVPLGGGWYDCRMIATAPNSATCFVGMANGDNAASYTGTSRSVLAYNVRCTQDRVSQWSDRSTAANHVSQATAANQPRWVASDADLGRPAVLFDGSNDALASATAAPFKFLHDGTGMTAIFALRTAGVAATTAWLDTSNAGALLPGVTFGVLNTGKWNILAYNGASAIITSNTVAVSADTNYVVTVSYLEGASPEWVVRVNGVQVDSGNSAAAPSSSNPGQVARLGGAASQAWPGKMHQCAMWNRQLTTDDMLRVERSFGAQIGVVIP